MKLFYCSTGKLCLYLSYVILLYFLLCAWRPARGQTPYSLQGRIVSAENQEPLVGASVVLKGTINGTSSDKNGYFTVTTVENRAILAVSFIGYRSLDTLLQLPLKKELILTLQQDLTMLEEVKVSTGYWETSKRLSTGNISKVTAETIAKQPVTNVLQALQGRMPGVYIQQTTGVAGGGFSIQIRGRNSISPARNNPLYIVDGVPFTPVSLSFSSISIPVTQGGDPLSSINPADIESIEVLKDADATSIYGSRGANGVILVTTKKARESKGNIDVQAYAGTGWIQRKMDLLNTDQYLQMRKEAFANDAQEATNTNAYDLLIWDPKADTDWQKKLIGGQAQIKSLNASLSSGGANTQISLGLGYYKETTVFSDDYSSTRFSGKVNVNHSSSDKKFKVMFSTNYSVSNSTLPQVDFTSSALSIAPNAPSQTTANGEINWANGTFSNNPLALLSKKYESSTSNLVANIVPSYRINPYLSIRANIGYTQMQMQEQQINPLKSYSPDLGLTSGISNFGVNGVKSWILEPQLEFVKKLGGGRLTIQIGTTFQESVNKGTLTRATGFSTDAMIENIAAASSLSVAASNYAQYRFQSLFARAGYVWREKYIVNVTARRDGSSRFGADRQYAVFKSFGAAWVFSEESFFRNELPFISFGKLRMSYGTTGSDQIGDYGYLNSYGPTYYRYQNQSGLYPLLLANSEFAWEITRKLELALDLNVYKDRINLALSWYRNTSSNQLVGLPLAPTTGFSSIQANLPAEVENKGFEISLMTTNVKKIAFSWTTSFNITLPENKLLAYPGLAGSSNASNYEIGKPLSIAKRYHNMGVNQQSGLYQFEDVNKNGSIDSPGDMLGLKSITQQFYGGIQNSFSAGRFQLDIFFQFVKQTGLNYMSGSVFGMPGTISNQPSYVLDRWQQPLDGSTLQKFSQNPDASTAYRRNRSSDNTLGNASFVRLKNVSLSYQCPLGWNKKMHLQSSRIFIQGQNLWTVTNYPGLDPETQSNAVLPPLAVLTAGFHLSF